MPDSPYNLMRTTADKPDPYSDPIPQAVKLKEKMKFAPNSATNPFSDPGLWLQQKLYGGGLPWYKQGFDQLIDQIPENPFEFMPAGGMVKKVKKGGKSAWDLMSPEFRDAAKKSAEQHRKDMLGDSISKTDTPLDPYAKGPPPKDMYGKPEWKPPPEKPKHIQDALDLLKPEDPLDRKVFDWVEKEIDPSVVEKARIQKIYSGPDRSKEVLRRDIYVDNKYRDHLGRLDSSKLPQLNDWEEWKTIARNELDQTGSDVLEDFFSYHYGEDFFSGNVDIEKIARELTNSSSERTRHLYDVITRRVRNSTAPDLDEIPDELDIISEEIVRELEERLDKVTSKDKWYELIRKILGDM